MPGRYTPPKTEQQRLVALANGVLVERDVLNVVEKIYAYDSNLRVKFLDPDRAPDMFDAPYLITEICPDGIERVVTQVWTLDETVYQRIIQADTHRHALAEQILFDMEERNRKIREEEARLEREKNEAVQELVADVINSPKDTYTATNPVTGEAHKFTSVPRSDS